MEFDLDQSDVRDLNAALHNSDIAKNKSKWKICNTKGRHAIAVGVDEALKILIDGHVGYYCAGMNKHADITVNGHCGPGVAENMMSGIVRIKGNASQYAGATAHGGLLVIEGDASSRLRNFNERGKYCRQRKCWSYERFYGTKRLLSSMWRRG